VASVGKFAWAATADRVWVHQFIDSEVDYDLGGPVHFSLATNYPWEGTAAVDVSTAQPRRFALSMRVPGWCVAYAVRLNGHTVDLVRGGDGYVTIDRTWTDGDRMELELALPVRFLEAHPSVSELAGMVAVARGPLVYCAEEVDNGPELHSLVVDPSQNAAETWDAKTMGGSLKVKVSARREPGTGTALYSPWGTGGAGEKVEVVLWPYHQWGNRRPGQEMRVWLRAQKR
jgi:uncharacterized protein